MKLTATDMAALIKAAKHMSGDDRVPMNERVDALLASNRMQVELNRLSIDVEIETTG